MLAAKELEMAWMLLLVVVELVVDVSQAVAKLDMLSFLDTSIVRWKATKASVLARLLDLLMAAMLARLLVVVPVDTKSKYSSVLLLVSSSVMIGMSRSGSEPPNAAKSSKSGRKSASS